MYNCSIFKILENGETENIARHEKEQYAGKLLSEMALDCFHILYYEKCRFHIWTGFMSHHYVTALYYLHHDLFLP